MLFVGAPWRDSELRRKCIRLQPLKIPLSLRTADWRFMLTREPPVARLRHVRSIQRLRLVSYMGERSVPRSAAGNIKDRTRIETACVRAEPRDQMRNLVRRTEALHRAVLDHGGQGLLSQIADHVGVDRS